MEVTGTNSALGVIAGLMLYIWHDTTRRIGKLEEAQDGHNKLVTAVAELTVEVRHLREMLAAKEE